MNELRICPIRGARVIISKKRAKRFKDVKGPKSFAATPRKSCPFCYGKELKAKETFRIDWDLMDRHKWDLRGFLNLSPYLEKKTVKLKRIPGGDGLFRIAVPHGNAEVLVESRDHSKQLATMTPWEIQEIFIGYRNRYEDLLKEWKEVLVFRNYGFFGGQSLTHPHSQIIAIDNESPDQRNEKRRANNYFNKHNNCIICDIIKKEKQRKVRVIFENEHFIALCPWAPSYPYETLIIPKQHQNSILEFSLDSMESLAEMYKKFFGSLSTNLFDPSYNYYIRNYRPKNAIEQKELHWFIRIVPRGISIPAGFEIGTGIESVNVVPPEDAAKLLRKTNKK